MGKLYVYENCIVCGDRNPIGFNIEFKHGDGFVYGIVNPGINFEGYGDVIHGGISSTFLDEVMVKALFSIDVIAITMEINIRFRKPVKTGMEITIKGYPGEVKSRVALARGEILLPDKSVAVEADGKFYILKDKEKTKVLGYVK
ncbi:MAG: PaaI family thioesterase [candidate division Zixibacteria bacterium]|nr:PaaI family thioesterase [candidate division Zixibacteria bacterium]